MVPTQNRPLSPSEIVNQLFPETEVLGGTYSSDAGGMGELLGQKSKLSGLELGEQRFQRLMARTAIARVLS